MSNNQLVVSQLVDWSTSGQLYSCHLCDQHYNIHSFDYLNWLYPLSPSFNQLFVVIVLQLFIKFPLIQFGQLECLHCTSCAHFNYHLLKSLCVHGLFLAQLFHIQHSNNFHNFYTTTISPFLIKGSLLASTYTHDFMPPGFLWGFQNFTQVLFYIQLIQSIWVFYWLPLIKMFLCQFHWTCVTSAVPYPVIQLSSSVWENMQQVFWNWSLVNAYSSECMGCHFCRLISSCTAVINGVRKTCNKWHSVQTNLCWVQCF